MTQDERIRLTCQHLLRLARGRERAAQKAKRLENRLAAAGAAKAYRNAVRAVRGCL